MYISNIYGIFFYKIIFIILLDAAYHDALADADEAVEAVVAAVPAAVVPVAVVAVVPVTVVAVVRLVAYFVDFQHCLKVDFVISVAV